MFAIIRPSDKAVGESPTYLVVRACKLADLEKCMILRTQDYLKPVELSSFFQFKFSMLPIGRSQHGVSFFFFEI